jgi:hypothetical protein
VWHLSETGTGTRYDSTANNNDATPKNYEGDEAVTGKIGGSDKLDGVDDHIEISKNASIKGSSQFTFEGWINIGILDGSSQNVYIETVQSSSTVRFIVHITVTDSLRFAGRAPDSDSVALWGFIDPIPANTWLHVAAVFDSVGDIHSLYLNGANDSESVSEPAIDNADPDKFPSIGALEGDDPFNGSIDEFRISTSARSADWITTEYNNQYNPASFYSVGNEEAYARWWADGSFSRRRDIIIDKSNVGSFAYQKTITIDHNQVSGSGSLLNFPILIDLYDTDLHDSSKVQVDGDDIRFASTTGEWYDHEIDYFDRSFNTTHAHLTAWVRIPSLSTSSDTTIRMYYGNRTMSAQENPTGVWDNNYAGVWHLSEDPAGTIYDSTSSNNQGNSSGGMTSDDLISGQIGLSLSFDGSDDYIDFGNDSSLNIGSGDFAFGMWFMISTVTNTSPLGGKGLSGANGKRYIITMGPNAECAPGEIKGEIDDDNVSKEYAKSAAKYDNSIWHYVVLVRDGTNLRLYINGTEIAVESIGTYGNLDMPDYSFYIGRIRDGVDRWGGQIDEVRISNSARSADWIATEYNNQRNLSSFFSVGDEEPGSTLTNFPVIVDITDNDLKTGNIQADSDDLLFVDANGIKLVHEVEYLSQTSSQGHLIAWVNVPTLYSSEDTILSMYYDNIKLNSQAKPEAVWDANFKGVWHLSEDPTGTMYDSTANSNDGTAQNSPAQASGQIDGSLDFDDTTQDY